MNWQRLKCQTLRRITDLTIVELLLLLLQLVLSCIARISVFLKDLFGGFENVFILDRRAAVRTSQRNFFSLTHFLPTFPAILVVPVLDLALTGHINDILIRCLLLRELANGAFVELFLHCHCVVNLRSKSEGKLLAVAHILLLVEARSIFVQFSSGGVVDNVAECCGSTQAHEEAGALSLVFCLQDSAFVHIIDMDHLVAVVAVAWDFRRAEWAATGQKCPEKEEYWTEDQENQVLGEIKEN